MSTGKKTPLSSAASAWPRSAFISKIATSTPTDASFRLVASPNPDAPPVTTAAIPDPNFMQALLPDGMLPPRSLPMAHPGKDRHGGGRSEEHTSELQSLMHLSYAVICLKKKTKKQQTPPTTQC